jgi:glycosyltransferase involved in cell wall biosynthesis
LRIAYFSPLPPQRSGIADYSFELLPDLGQLAEVTLFVADPALIDGRILKAYDVRSHKQFPTQRDSFDLALYHIGNSEYHDDISRLALEYPGVIVLHDFNLHHSVALRTIGKGDPWAFAREMGYEQGVVGVRQALALKSGFEASIVQSPLNRRLLDVSLGVIVHSQYVANLVRRQGYKGPMAVIPALINPIAGNSRRAQLNLPEDAVLFGSFGLVTKEKQIEKLLQSLQRLRIELPQAHYLLVGDSMPEIPVKETIKNLNLDEVVHVIGYVPELVDFIDWIHTSDVVVNLRNPTMGETSAIALRAMAAGKPLLVNDHGWYREIPSDAALKIAPGSDDALLEALRLTGQSLSLRKRMGEAGLRYTHEFCRPKIVARTYYQELDRISKMVGVYG